jgi:hypothetical protein
LTKSILRLQNSLRLCSAVLIPVVATTTMPSFLSFFHLFCSCTVLFFLFVQHFSKPSKSAFLLYGAAWCNKTFAILYQTRQTQYQWILPCVWHDFRSWTCLLNEYWRS